MLLFFFKMLTQFVCAQEFLVQDDELGYYDDGEEHLFDESYRVKRKQVPNAVERVKQRDANK